MRSAKERALRAEHYRAILLAKRAELTSASSKLVTGLSELGRVAADDQAPVVHEQFVSLQVRMLEHQMLKQIDAALDRLATEQFGVCAKCGEDISPKRLAAIPWAHWCIACQERSAPAYEQVSSNRQAA